MEKSDKPDFLGELPPPPALATFVSGVAAALTKQLQSVGVQQLVVVNFTVNVEKIVVDASENNSITAGPGANVQANQGSGTHTLTSTIKTLSPQEQALDTELANLTKLVGQLIAQFPSSEEGSKVKVERALTTLKQEAASKTPDREWYELSAKGLLDAAKAVASLTTPITASVKAVLALLTPA